MRAKLLASPCVYIDIIVNLITVIGLLMIFLPSTQASASDSYSPAHFQIAASHYNSVTAQDTNATLRPSFQTQTGEPYQVVITLPRGNVENQVGISQPIWEQESQGPQAIRVGDDDNLYIGDTLNQRLVTVNPTTGDISNIAVRAVGYFSDLAIDEKHIYLMDMATNSVHVLDYTGKPTKELYVPDAHLYHSSGIDVDNSGRVFWQISGESEFEIIEMTNLAPTYQQSVPTRQIKPQLTSRAYTQKATRVSAHEIRLDISTSNKPTATTTLNISVPHFIGTAEFIRRDTQGNSYVLVEELIEDIPTFIVETTVRKFSAAGNLLGVASLPTQDAFFIPTRFVDVGPAGNVYFLRVDEDSAKVLRMEFETSFVSKLDEIWKGRRATIEQSLAEDGQILPFSRPMGTITRDQIMQNASVYADLQWTASAANLTGTACTAADGRGKPPYLDSYSPGSTVTGVPYKWGGYATISQFLTAMAAGKAAGDVNWQGGTVIACASGVDCSGYVSVGVWNDAHKTTYSMLDISSRLGNWQDLLRGDAANSSGHIVLFDSFASSGINTYEATLDCEGKVCRWSRSYTYLNNNGYYPIRYNNVTGGGGTDITKPDGDITSPTEGAIITSRTVRLAGWASDSGTGVDRAHFTASAPNWHQVGPDFNSASFSYDWDMCADGVPDGQVTLGLDIWDKAGNQANTPRGNRHFIKSYNCNPTPAPSAQFDAWPQSGRAPLTVALHIVSTANITSCSWDYGDGQTGASCSSSHDHTYTSPGTYTVRLTVNGPGGSDTQSRSNYITVSSPALSASWSSPSNGQTITARTVGLSANVSGGSGGINRVAFSAAYGGSWHGVYTGYSAPYAIDWDLCAAGVPDGDIELGLEAWDNAGNHYVYSQHYANYHITKSYNCTPAPSAQFDAWPQSGRAPLTVALHIVSTANITSCSWDYGDGQTGTSCASSHDHTYSSAGSFTVKLNVSGPGGSDSMTRTGYINATSTCYTLTKNVSPAGSGTVNTSPPPSCNNGTQYTSGTVVQLTAAPASGYTFLNWTGDAIGMTSLISVTMRSNQTVTANFSAADTTPPSASWSNPSNGQAITAHTVRLQADASDNLSGVNRVAFSAKWSGGWHGVHTLYASPYTYDWNLCAAGVPDGDIELGLEAWDNAGNHYVYSQHHANYHIIKSGGCKAVTVDNVTIHLADSPSASTFNVGDTVSLEIGAINNTTSTQASSWSWATYNAAGIMIQPMSFDDWQYTMPPGAVGAELPRKIPPDLPGGIYTFIGTVRIGSDSDSKQVSFTVTPTEITRRAQVEAFVTRLYHYCLLRNPEPEGLNWWTEVLLSRRAPGSGVVQGFIFSQEFINRMTTDEEYLRVLYQSLFDRSPNQDELNEWLDKMRTGVSRESVLTEFSQSVEFVNLCRQYGIIPSRRAMVEALVAQLYQQFLKREPEPQGLDWWTNVMLSDLAPGSEVAHGFVFSREYANRLTTNEEFLTNLYYALLNREPEPDGLDWWLDKMENRGITREDVLEGFTQAPEFIELCQVYGIAPSRRGQVEAFVSRFHVQFLTRSPSEAEKMQWTNWLLDGSHSASEFARSLALGQEFINRQTTDTEFVRILYRAFFNRECEPAELNWYLDRMRGGTGREAILDGFTHAPEFISMCERYKIRAN